VKARAFQYLPLCALLLAACGPTTSRSPADAITFDSSKGLDDFEFAAAGEGSPGEWSVIESVAGRVLAQTDIHRTNDRFPLAIYRPFSGRDVYVTVRFMTIPGEAIKPLAHSSDLHRLMIITSPARAHSKTTLDSIVSSPESAR